jgi:outer membrane protein assembly factor BamE (lipoprotein component of BamABCDE complex)
MRRKWSAASALVALALLAGVIWFAVRPGRHFDPSLWSNSQTSESVRLRMADDLIRNRRLLGLTRQEVVTLLGEPLKTEYFKEFDFVYYLGSERGFMGIDSEWLVLKLGQDGRVNRARISRD